METSPSRYHVRERDGEPLFFAGLALWRFDSVQYVSMQLIIIFYKTAVTESRGGAPAAFRRGFFFLFKKNRNETTKTARISEKSICNIWGHTSLAWRHAGAAAWRWKKKLAGLELAA